MYTLSLRYIVLIYPLTVLILTTTFRAICSTLLVRELLVEEVKDVHFKVDQWFLITAP